MTLAETSSAISLIFNISSESKDLDKIGFIDSTTLSKLLLLYAFLATFFSLSCTGSSLAPRVLPNLSTVSITKFPDAEENIFGLDSANITSLYLVTIYAEYFSL